MGAVNAYLIDTPNSTVRLIDYNGDWESIAQLLHCQLFTTVVDWGSHDAIYVDDEGLINGNPHGWFLFNDQPLKGYGLILGTGTRGEATAPIRSLHEWTRRITFPKDINEVLRTR